MSDKQPRQFTDSSDMTPTVNFNNTDDKFDAKWMRSKRMIVTYDVGSGATTHAGASTSQTVGGTTLAITDASVTPASIITATIATSANTVSVAKVTQGAGTFTVTFSASPGAGTVVAYTITNPIGKMGVFFIAPTDLTIIQALLQTQTGTTGVATAQIEKLIDTEAPGAGVDVLATPFDLQATINVTQSQRPILETFPKNLKRKDRLALKATGSLSGMQGCVIVVEYQYKKQFTQ